MDIPFLPLWLYNHVQINVIANQVHENVPPMMPPTQSFYLMKLVDFYQRSRYRLKNYHHFQNLCQPIEYIILFLNTISRNIYKYLHNLVFYSQDKNLQHF